MRDWIANDYVFPQDLFQDLPPEEEALVRNKLDRVMTDLLPEFVIQSRQENENLNAKLISTKIISEVDFGGKIDFQIYLLIISYLTEASINA